MIGGEPERRAVVEHDVKPDRLVSNPESGWTVCRAQLFETQSTATTNATTTAITLGASFSVGVAQRYRAGGSSGAPSWGRPVLRRGSHELKLMFKQRNGAKVTKRHATATTPQQRAVTHKDMRKRPSITMNATFKQLKPAALSRQVLALAGQLEILAQAKKAPRSKPPVNTAWNNSDWRRKSNEATT